MCIRDSHYADWLALDNPDKATSFGGTDRYFVASAYYRHCTYLTARAAEALGDEESRKKYDALSEEIKLAMQREYFTPCLLYTSGWRIRQAYRGGAG